MYSAVKAGTTIAEGTPTLRSEIVLGCKGVTTIAEPVRAVETISEGTPMGWLRLVGSLKL